MRMIETLPELIIDYDSRTISDDDLVILYAMLGRYIETANKVLKEVTAEKNDREAKH